MISVKRHDWKAICEAASKEHDSEKLMKLVSELMRALDNCKTPLRKMQEPS